MVAIQPLRRICASKPEYRSEFPSPSAPPGFKWTKTENFCVKMRSCTHQTFSLLTQCNRLMFSQQSRRRCSAFQLCVEEWTTAWWKLSLRVCGACQEQERPTPLLRKSEQQMGQWRHHVVTQRTGVTSKPVVFTVMQVHKSRCACHYLLSRVLGEYWWEMNKPVVFKRTLSVVRTCIYYRSRVGRALQSLFNAFDMT